MKVTIDTKNNTCKVGTKDFNDTSKEKQNAAVIGMRRFLHDNTMMSDYEEDCMWMSYRYCVGRHTIASHGMAGDIAKNCYKRMSDERSMFTAYDINRSIEDCMRFGKGPDWLFPITSLNKIYTTAIDIFCEFLEDYDIKSKEDYLKYRSINVILSDNERGYKFETETWEEWLRPQVHGVLVKIFENPEMTEDYAWEYFNKWMNKEIESKTLDDELSGLTKGMPNPDYFYFHDIEDLFVWNDLAHLFDIEHHHKSILIDGSECEWFWTWTEKSEKHEDGYYYKAFGYKKIRVPVNKWNGLVTTYIPDESIKEDLY
jgi:hypothetical protein